MKNSYVSRATIGRIPVYLNYIKNNYHGTENISATSLARALGLGEVQVRKDLSAVSGAGRPKTGYNIGKLTQVLEEFLGGKSNIVIVGAGKLGRALLDYGGFADYGLNITAAFDAAADDVSHTNNGKPIFPADRLEGFCAQNNVKIGIITVPAAAAQEVCDRLVGCGVKGIWCFAPSHLNVPEGIEVQYENMALSLAYLNKRI